MGKRQTTYLILVPVLLIGIAGCHPFAQGMSHTLATGEAMVSTPIPTPTATHSPTPVPTETPLVLANGRYQWRLSSAGLTFSCPPEILRSWDVYRLDVRQQAISLYFKPRGAFGVVAYPRPGFSLEAVARSPNLVRDLYLPPTPLPTPTPNAAQRMDKFLIRGDPALRLSLSDTDLRVADVWLEHGDFVFHAVGWGGEMAGDVLYSPSERHQILVWFNQIMETFEFSNKAA